jgi:D-alanyl-D-alanine dipeptidase
MSADSPPTFSAVLAVCALALQLPGPAIAGDGEFVSIDDVAPSIVHSLRYSTEFNFTGKVVEGYGAGHCLLTRRTADALARAESLVSEIGYHLVLFDCYRPRRAVLSFLKWTELPGLEEDPSKQYFAPNVQAGRLVPEGYISARSSHSRGNAVDVGLVTTGVRTVVLGPLPRDQNCTAGFPPQQAIIDMGSSFDCFDERSGTRAKGLSASQLRNREILMSAMVTAGFTPYTGEWWHFSFPPGDGGQVFDFPIED